VVDCLPSHPTRAGADWWVLYEETGGGQLRSPQFIQSSQESHSKISHLGLAVRVGGGGGVRVARGARQSIPESRCANGVVGSILENVITVTGRVWDWSWRIFRHQWYHVGRGGQERELVHSQMRAAAN